MNRVDLQPCYILKTQAYKETSVIHQVFSLDYGVVSIISKGSRVNTSKRGSLLQAHRALLISWSGKGELKTLTAVEERLPIAQLKGTALYCGFYVNELLLNFLHKHDAHAELFNGFATVIAQLSANTALEANLRQFEKLLLN
ncbi:MAG: DNA repair protein RecO, partial [Cycloclasticus sp.]